LNQITELIDSKAITSVSVTSVFPLLQAQRAHELIEQPHHVRGKIVLEVAI
jgi:NADPH:quinone reductase-like Zn-dependent oxidoreductase